MIKNSVPQKIRMIFSDNPDVIFSCRSMTKIYNGIYSEIISVGRVSTVLSRLHSRGLVMRTLTQLSEGYNYSLKNEEGLDNLYEQYLLPYEFENRKEVLSELRRTRFESLEEDEGLLDEVVKLFPFKDIIVSSRQKLKEFLPVLVGFLMCDGHLKRDMSQLDFSFRELDDAYEFMDDFNEVFPEQNCCLWDAGNYCSVHVSCNALVEFMVKAGVPVGNKTKKNFLVPDWIINGDVRSKRDFLSTVMGNEGGAPQEGRWRIQFVLSKKKDKVLNLLHFLNQLRGMLLHFDILTSNILLRKQKGRCFHGRFYIKRKRNIINFDNHLSLKYASEKQEKLRKLIDG